MRCNICGGTTFINLPKRPLARCTTCWSLERTRVAALYLLGEDRPAPDATVLHFAPEKGLSRKLRSLASGYRAFDIAPDNYPDLGVEPFDLCRDVYGLEPGSADLIIHNHVIEHLECNYSAVLLRLARALKPSGRMLFSMPILPGGFTDELMVGSLDDKLTRFGPSLHVRRFGDAKIQETIGMIFTIPERYDLLARFPADQLRDANIPEHHWQAYTGASIFRVTPADVRV